jgi:hypothetical protein
MSNSNTVIVCGKPSAELLSELERIADGRMEGGAYSRKSVDDVRALDTMPLKGDVFLSAELVEAFRRLCQLHNVTLLESEISSHRRFVGPVIVFGKKMLYRILRPLLEKTLHQQQEFNAAAIYALGALASNIKGKV